MHAHADFWQLTAEALDYACERHAVADADLRQRLLETYRQLSAYPEVVSMLRPIRGAGVKTAILSNSAPLAHDVAYRDGKPARSRRRRSSSRFSGAR
jgi:2-haloacid dehalogenase